MNRQAHMETILPRTRRLWHIAGLLSVHNASELEPYRPPSTPSPRARFFAWRDEEDDESHRKLWSPHSLLLQPEQWRATEHGSAAVRLHGRPYRDALQTIVSIERHLSHIFPAHPRSLASVHSPRPAALRVSALAIAALWVSAFRKSFVQRTQKDFPNLPKKTPLDLGSGAHSRRFAQECPEGNPGKYEQEK